MMKLIRHAPLLFLVPMLACGDDGGGSSTPAAPFESQEEDDQVAGSLTPAEQTAFCEELLAYTEREVSQADLKKLGCYFLAIAFTGGDASQCNQAAQGCISDPETSGSDDPVECDTSRLTDCTATVGELETCYTDTITVVKTLVGSLSCNSSPAQLSALENKPASCQVVQAKCPKLFEDEDDTQP